ncbi:hypothetical protein [Ideonella sp. YS5]|uniref:hypothetical protein n=1 Tax=Ideonella sp. YS5 TaxID=3453714 RepID=UPI003EE8CFE8
MRNEQNRLRIGRIGVDLHLAGVASGMKSLERVLEQFEDFCIVTQSVRAGITVDVRVFDLNGACLLPSVALETHAEPAMEAGGNGASVRS